ncbi:hypothetical protein [Pseudoalteromonas sp. KAN5]|uniref:hypothetical protein n=1 Tax=Pseudoalteromonas sp. KAN5 TaxID=2916633 RepID=UPI001FCA6BA8|nr:hypothetical protein [Pseudoalteromonas sp. KAN5]BDF94323.1 lambda phage protein of known function [Pseudoalteromonas sp. KAN5]
MAAFTASQASVTNGFKVVTINSGESIANIRQGDFLFLAGFLVEINRGYVGSSNQQYIELVKNWANSNQSSQPATVIPTTGDFRAAVDAINNANKNVNDNFVAMQNWQTDMGTVTFTNQDGTTTTVKTLKQIEADNAAQMDAYHPYPWAMRKVEFEARRAANNEKFAASGFVHFGKHGGGTAFSIVNEGVMTSGSSGISLDGQIGLGMGSGYTGVVSGKSKSYPSIIHIAGCMTILESLKTDAYGVRVLLPEAEDGTRTYDSATGISVTHATAAIAFASETETNKVVTNRVDMCGFEAFLREINDADPFVYKYGLIQSQATDINGVATGLISSLRPNSYFAWYEGDASSRGRGINWQTASEAQRRVIVSDPENNIYFDDATGKFYQWCVRGRSLAGAGNGDWPLIDSYLLHGGFDTKSRLKVQGATDDDTAFEGNSSFSHYRGYLGTSNKLPTVGAFTAHANTAGAKAVNGECYFYVCGTVNRLNTGLYHPSFNPLGATKASDDKDWSQTSVSFVSKADCFDSAKLLAGSGSIASGKNGRPDGRYYDAIYASGQGGVCRDMRYSAWGLTQEDFAEADLAIKAGEYRGLELPKISKVIDNEYWLTSTHTNKTSKWINYQGSLVLYMDTSDFGVINGDSIIVVDRTKDLIFKLQKMYDSNNSTVKCLLSDTLVIQGEFPDGSGALSSEVYLIHESNSTSSISDDYYHTDVQGPPSEILLCDDLKDGWCGSWLPDLPDGAKGEFQLTRPYTGTGTDITRTHTLNSGATWSQSTTNIDKSAKNTMTSFANMPANQVTIWQYKTKAKTMNNSMNSDVYGPLGDIYFGSRCLDIAGRSFAFDLISKIPTDSQSDLLTYGSIPLSGFSIFDNKLLSSRGGMTHDTLQLVSPNNASPAFKALNYNVVVNQQGFINYAYTELKHDGTDWGDDSKIHIVDNQSTMLDENGNTVLVGTARCVEPLGWIKNDK